MHEKLTPICLLQEQIVKLSAHAHGAEGYINQVFDSAILDCNWTVDQ